MPTYRYRRPDGTTFEVLQKFSDAPLTEDPDTGVPVERVISGGAGLKFKGSGFYLTDYAKKSTAPAGATKASGASSDSGSSSGSSSTKSDSSGSTPAKSDS